MRIILAGYNVDRELLDDWYRAAEKVLDFLAPESLADFRRPTPGDMATLFRNLIAADNITPETISAAYARISRDPRPVDLLREEARRWVGKARRSNRSIVFEMGHASIAEHCVFNLDIIGVSRLVTELIQRHRLCSFTEKSQRYIRLGEDYTIPREVREAGLEDAMKSFVKAQFARYNKVCSILESEAGLDPKESGEDARYLLPLCVTTQMGMTANARSIEYLLQCAASSEIEEFRAFGRQLHRVIEGIAPSLVKYTEGSQPMKQLDTLIREKLPLRVPVQPSDTMETVVVRDVSSDPDTTVLAALIARTVSAPEHVITDHVSQMDERTRRGFVSALIGMMEPWDPAPRELEYAWVRFELLVSAAAYGQLKRHRLTTQTPGPYNPDLGMTIPPSFNGTGAEDVLNESARAAENLYQQLCSAGCSQVAPYVLLGANRRRIWITMNAREIIHFSRLREDIHAQWDIRDICSRMVEKARTHMPVCMMMAGGKHDFEGVKGNLSCR